MNETPPTAIRGHRHLIAVRPGIGAVAGQGGGSAAGMGMAARHAQQDGAGTGREWRGSSLPASARIGPRGRPMAGGADGEARRSWNRARQAAGNYSTREKRKLHDAL